MTNDNQNRWYRWLCYIIKHWPRCVAYLFVEWIEEQSFNHEYTGLCLPCAAKHRRNHDGHILTTGPYSDYCCKCGLEKDEWPKRCANRCVQVNNKPKGESLLDRLKPLFWE